ncbi:MAG TPA: hypothetical protein VGN88_10760 [Phycisphaerae bacterium]|jgi:hypothetical protein
MSKLNLKEASLLDISGELEEGAREELRAKIAVDSADFSEYEKIQENFKLLEHLPIPEPSAAERKRIPAMIKKAIHAALPLQKEAVGVHGVSKGAVRDKQLRNWIVSWKSAGLAIAACLGITALFVWAKDAPAAPTDALAAHINAVIDRSAASIDPMVSNEKEGGLTKGSESAGSLTLAEEPDLDVGQLLKHQEPAGGGSAGTGSDDVVGSSSPPGSF